MQVERVQKWVMAVLLATVLLILATGMCFLAATSDAPGARPGLLLISAAIGLVAMAGVLLIHEVRPVSPWLLVGLLPAGIGTYLLYFTS